MDQTQHNETTVYKPKYFEEIRTAIIEKQRLSFVYGREGGEVITHNAIYPRQLFQKGNRFYFRAYCHFPGDTRVFRLDRVKSLQVKPRQEPLTQKQILGVAVVILAALLAFLALLLF
ncbi:MAG: helix-turn-helix transcriptional regulator [Thermodesulfobacteriota bacterium]